MALMCKNLASCLVHLIVSKKRVDGRIIWNICEEAGTIPVYFLPYVIILVCCSLIILD